MCQHHFDLNSLLTFRSRKFLLPLDCNGELCWVNSLACLDTRAFFAFELILQSLQLRLSELPSTDDTIWIILLVKIITVNGCLHHRKRVWFVFGVVSFPHFSIEFCQNLIQSSRAESLNHVINISRFTPFHPHCHSCLHGSLCVFACSQLVYRHYFFTQHHWKTGLFQSKWCW